MSRILVAGFLCSTVLGCRHDEAAPSVQREGTMPGTVTINDPPKLTSIEVSGKTDNAGRPLRVACVTCHSVRDAGGSEHFPTSTSELREFHGGLTFEHGKLACTACHVDRRGGVARLHLADGTEIPMVDAMRLCAQCHGAKRVQYDHGAHGGMNGAWDLGSGGRLRNHCVDCHDPHAPAFPAARPVLPPRDRGALQGGSSHE